MVNKNTNQRLDQVEETLGMVQDRIETVAVEVANISKRLEQLIKLQEEFVRQEASSSGKGTTPPEGDGPFFSTGHRHEFKYKKFDMPDFDGTNPDGWIMKAERYFNLHRLNNEEKLEAAVIGFEGDALLWYQWETKRRPMVLWEEMKALILKQFRSTQTGSLHEQWLTLSQDTTVKEYRRRFFELAAPLEDIPTDGVQNTARATVSLTQRITNP